MAELERISAEIVQFGILVCALLLALGVALGGVEGQLGALLGDPTPGMSARGRLVVLVVALLLAASAVPIANAVVEALF